MPESRRDFDFLGDILEAITRITEYTSEYSWDRFISDRKTQDAVIRNLEIIGEATKRLSSEFRTTHTDIPWREMAALRDRLIHNYFGINTEILWEIVQHDLPAVLPELTKISDK
jgi:uncharacterized protein with HEPN domain